VTADICSSRAWRCENPARLHIRSEGLGDSLDGDGRAGMQGLVDLMEEELVGKSWWGKSWWGKSWWGKS
jgi:hypothetical protein